MNIVRGECERDEFEENHNLFSGKINHRNIFG